jgi:2-oxoisovalerate dehydrogenase E1 component
MATHTQINIEKALFCFEKMLLCREIDIKQESVSKQNKGGTFHISSNGHELIGVLSAMHLRPKKDFALCYYRDRGLSLGLGADPIQLLGSHIARNTQEHSAGRMMPDHYCSKELRLICQSSVVGAQLLHAVGIAKSCKLNNSGEVVYVSIGEGGTSQGDFHEALNFSALHRLPVLFVVQDNGYAISVPVKEQTAGENIAKIAKGYEGLTVFDIDGTDYVQTEETLQKAIPLLQKGPVLIRARVVRLSSHSSSDNELKYKTQNQLQLEKEKDPLLKLEQLLLDNGVSMQEMDALKTKIKENVNAAAHIAQSMPHPDPKTVLDHVFKEHFQEDTLQETQEGEKVVMIDAINNALKEEMAKDPSIVVFGQDVAHGKGGVFGASRELTQLFGKERCFNTPLAESSIVGIAIGMSLTGYHKPVVEIQFADYMWTGINQIFNELSSIHYRSNGMFHCPVTIRMPCGGYIQGGPYHSQNVEGFLAHCPGLKIAMPTTTKDAKALLKSAIHDPNPVIFLEHKGLYRQRHVAATTEPGADERLGFGKARFLKKGGQLTIVSTQMMSVMAYDIVQRLNLDVDLIDLRTVVPYDFEAILESVKKTNKVLLLQEAAKTHGFMAEVAARLSFEAFQYLDAPITRIGALDCPVPYSKVLEDTVLPQSKEIEEAILKLLRY